MRTVQSPVRGLVTYRSKNIGCYENESVGDRTTTYISCQIAFPEINSLEIIIILLLPLLPLRF